MGETERTERCVALSAVVVDESSVALGDSQPGDAAREVGRERERLLLTDETKCSMKALILRGGEKENSSLLTRPTLARGVMASSSCSSRRPVMWYGLPGPKRASPLLTWDPEERTDKLRSSSSW